MNFVVEGHQMYYSQRLANIVGIEEAAILQQLHYRLKHQGKKKVGHFWYCQTHHQWTKQHTYWNAAKIGRLLLKLEQRKLIISTRKFNRFSTDRSKWYRIDYTQLQNCLMRKKPVTMNWRCKAACRSRHHKMIKEGPARSRVGYYSLFKQEGQ